MTGIIDYGLGNLGSIKNMLKVIGEKSVISGDISILRECDRLILPGVGAYDSGMNNINNLNLDEFIRDSVTLSGKSLLGICLGMQLLGRGSEEGTSKGLGLIPFDCKRFNIENSELKVPHMGWDVVNIMKNTPITTGLTAERQRYYFVHSYYAVCDDDNDILMSCEYGCKFAAAVVRDNVIGVQFHPEKSHVFGMKLLSNFVKEY